MVAMAMHPEVQKKAQAELDRYIDNRLPDFNDLQALTYIQAIVLETLRWMPTVPVGIAHGVTADDTYKGWHIPKDTIVMAVSLHNSWNWQSF